MDETGFLMSPTVRRTWAPKGQTPILRHRVRHYQKVSGIGALSISPKRRRLGLYFHWHPDDNITGSEVIMFLRELLAHLRGHVVLIWDRLNAHRSRQVQLWWKAHTRLTIEWLPPYAPELNAVEYVWSYLKYHRLSNHGLYELDDLYEHVQGEAGATASQQSLLRSFVHATELPIRLRK